MIFELLNIGEGQARTARQLAEALGTNIRRIGILVERERRAGKPICASAQGSNPGYYIPANREEMERYCKRLHHRAGEIFKTRAACLQTLTKLETAEDEA